VLQDEKQILEANPAAMRIMGCQSSQELLGKHPGDTSPPFQPNGESSAVLARKYIQECMANELHRNTNEGPQTTVTLSSGGVWIGKYEVTQGEY
jgi:hypothetical protein